MAREFKFSTGTVVTIDDSIVDIDRTNAKSAVRGLGGIAVGRTCIKISAISGILYFANALMICAYGFAAPSNFSALSINEKMSYPNSILGGKKDNELMAELYNHLAGIIQLGRFK
ncbi:hypothetical protein SAMN04515656_11234 [Eubacterium aggregans]|uniref:Uncharacterized protein n=1 Tax=Eubacterium aggregans TaxID=81409 RepID=A0A1H4BQ88_9FIRM|nr:hypothetical protein [Eubacterium aggregans]SEA50268.1 hypothetical protein SAMN04515656_11234 [Eubacterium aggregans]